MCTSEHNQSINLDIDVKIEKGNLRAVIKSITMSIGIYKFRINVRAN